nr:MAG TPA: hypothetical protein [Caudoviricetes sp.]
MNSDTGGEGSRKLPSPHASPPSFIFPRGENLDSNPGF